MNQQLKQKIKTLPSSPGVYLHKNQQGEIIYVGKAAVLKNRVRQYFQKSTARDLKTEALIAEINDVDWLVTESEIDALFLESELIKRYKPQYNILLRDDKSQTFVRIDMKSQWPCVKLTRNPADDGAEYFGPFYNGFALKKALRYLRKAFPYYTKPPKKDQRLSLDAHIGLEPVNLSSAEYKRELKKLISYIKGNRVQLIRQLEAAMKQTAKEHNFEKAAYIRNQLYGIKELQRRIMFSDQEFMDISKDRALVYLQKILGLTKPPTTIEGFDISHMSGRQVVASQVVFVNGVSNRTSYKKYKLNIQQNDDSASIREVILRRLSPRNVSSWGLPDVILIDGGKPQLSAALQSSTERGYDLPIIAIAKQQEQLIIKSTQVNETYIKSQKSKDLIFNKQGDYCFIDLHPGQINAGSHSKNLRGVSFSKFSDLVKLIQRIRDEAHRFAINYHSSLKNKTQTVSLLEEIPGIGSLTRKKLIRHFGSLRLVAKADETEVAAVIGQARARAVYAVIKESNINV